MKPGVIYLYAGKVEEWTREWKEEKNRESLCGRLLLLYGLEELGYEGWTVGHSKGTERASGDFPGIRESLKELEGALKRGPYGKPYLAGYPDIHFNISHSGGYGVCAISSMPCGVDIQEKRAVRSKRMIERTMNAQEQRQILEAEDSTKEFIKLWTYKESCIKLSGKGLHQDMRTMKVPACHRYFWLKKDLVGCVAAEEPFQMEIRRLYLEEKEA